MSKTNNNYVSVAYVIPWILIFLQFSKHTKDKNYLPGKRNVFKSVEAKFYYKKNYFPVDIS